MTELLRIKFNIADYVLLVLISLYEHSEYTCTYNSIRFPIVASQGNRFNDVMEKHVKLSFEDECEFCKYCYHKLKENYF